MGAWALSPTAKILGANDDIRMAVIGLRSRGKDLLNAFSRIDGVTIAALCDADEAFLRREKKVFPNAYTTTDIRKVLERSDIDVVAVATPNHWHALACVWALQAGKNVYLEKPVSHSIWEGGQLLRAEAQYGKMVGAGFQNRSDTGLVPFMRDLHAGEYGKVTAVRGLCYRNRSGIGQRKEPLSAPFDLDYDLWLGPAQHELAYRNSFHYDWHWMWSFGNGDVGNQGPHEMDLIRWALNDPTDYPEIVESMGGRFVWNDAGETPNVLLTRYVYNGIPCTFEVNDIPNQNRTMSYKGVGVGIVVTTEEGEFRGGRGGGRFYDRDGKEVKHYPGDSGGGHYRNYIECLRDNKPENLRSPLASAVVSSGLSHMANTSYLVPRGEVGGNEPFRGDSVMRETIARHVEHLDQIEADYNWHRGCELGFDSDQLRFRTSPIEPMTTNPVDVEAANRMLKRQYRKPYVLPEDL